MKNVSSKERIKPCFFVIFNIIIRHIFPENFTEMSQVVQKLWRIFLSILAIFINFYHFFWIFWFYLVTKKLMASSYNRWCQYFFTLNIIQIDCLTIVFINCVYQLYKVILKLNKFFLKYEGGSNWPLPPSKNYLQKAQPY